jgi:endoglucanase
MPARLRFLTSARFLFFAAMLLAIAPRARSQSAFVRVSLVGYEAGESPFRAYLMSTAPVRGARFKVSSSSGAIVHEGKVGALLGTWSHTKTVVYNVYALDFTAPAGRLYWISVAHPAATSPLFAVDTPENLYSGLLLNTLFYYQTERDGANFIRNALRTEPGHEKDANARVFLTPPLDDNDLINNTPPTPPLVTAGLPNIDASGGWWDAGDYTKYVETTSYTVALMQIGVRDFPEQMGARARLHPPAPPGSISYAGNSGPGAPRSSDFSGEARFGVNWLLKMWNSQTRTLYYQIDDTQDWNYYGLGSPSSARGNCGGTYVTPYCLITEYDIWTLPQAADHFEQPGDPHPCDPFTTFFICNRPVYVAGPAGSRISPNLAGRLAAAFALCYQLNRENHPSLANRCLKNAEDIFELADTSYPDPAPSVGSGTCGNCLLTIAPFDGYPETVWEDDMELGATELFFALRSAGEDEDLPPGLVHTNPMDYLAQAAHFARGYVTNIYNTGNTDTLNLYDVSSLAHFELYRALDMAEDPGGLAVSKASVRRQLLRQVADAITQANTDPWGFGYPWSASDSTSHGAGLSVMASEAYALTHAQAYATYSQRWLANILGSNAWGSSFIVGDGSTFPNCIQHQVANLAGALDGTSGGTPVLWGAASEGPGGALTSGVLDNMILCPADGVDLFKKFNGNGGAFDPSQTAVYQDNVQSFSTTEPAIDLTATSFLMWSWRMARH